METDLGHQIRELIDRGARPVSFQEITRRQVPAVPRTPVRRRTVITLTASGVAAAGCAAGLAIAFASPGTPARPAAQPFPSTRTSPATPSVSSSQASAYLTAQTVRRMAVASRAALANSGIEQINYRCVKNGTVTSAGLDTVTYSGSDYQYATSLSVPAGVRAGAIRVVDGQFYIQTVPQNPAAPWTHLAGQDTTPHFAQATTLLKLLSPAAAFQNDGTEVIGGIALTHLHATKVSGLPDDPALGRYANLVADQKMAIVPPGTLTGLDLWTDSNGVVHQMKILLRGGDGQATVTVTFTGIGQRQTITVPPTFKPVS
jgi:hypothetical protein